MQNTTDRRATFNEALATELEESLTTAYVNADRLSWVQDPESLASIDNWLELAEGIRARLLIEKGRRQARERRA